MFGAARQAFRDGGARIQLVGYLKPNLKTIRIGCTLETSKAFFFQCVLVLQGKGFNLN